MPLDHNKRKEVTVEQVRKFIFQVNIPEQVTNVVIVNIRGPTEAQLVASKLFWENSVNLNLSRKALHLCLCGINRKNIDLALRFQNKTFSSESIKGVLILYEQAKSALLPALPFSLGDQAAVHLLKQGYLYSPYALSTPLLDFESSIFLLPTWENFVNRQKLIPTCKIQPDSPSCSMVNFPAFVKELFTKE